MKRLMFAFSMVAILTSGADADDLEDQLSSIFDQLDKNSDDVVTPDEVTEEQTRHFNRLLRRGDTDENGELSRDEFIAATGEDEAPVTTPEEGAARGGAPDGQRLAITPEMLARLDADGDGNVTLEEIPEDLRPRFARLFERLEVEEIELARLRELAQRQQQLLTERFNDPPAGERPRGEEGDRPEGDRPREEGDTPREGDRERGEGDQPREGDRPEGDRPPDGDRPGFGEFRGPEFFRRIDENGDRRLSEDEVARLSEIFGELDRNEDGQLDMGELMGFQPGAVGGTPRPDADPRREFSFPRPEDLAPRPEGDPQRPPGDFPRPGDLAPRPEGDPRRQMAFPGFNPGQFFSALDTDGSGSLSEEETPERLRPSFAEADGNDDGQLSPEELIGLMQRQQGGRSSAPDVEMFFNNLDRDDDGFISADEMPEGRAEEMLERADADDDGKISQEELRAVMPRGPRPDGDRGEGRPEGDRPDRERPDAEDGEGGREGDERPDR